MTCETCLRFENDHEHNEPDPECQDCMKYIIHKQKASISRQHYDADKKKDTQTRTEVYVSADMQKVLMLPAMTGVKSCVFTNRLVVFHDTFSPLGEQKKKNPKQTRAVLWHEGVAGRSAPDVTSSFVKAVQDLAEDAPT